MADIKHLLHISTPRQKVYEAISTIDGLKNWWTLQTTGESKPGGDIDFRFGNYGGPTMKVTALKPGESVQWECTKGFDDWVGTNLSFTLDENEGKTRVRFNHNGWREANDFFAGCSFSWGRYMESLRQLCETGKGAPFGSDNYR